MHTVALVCVYDDMKFYWYMVNREGEEGGVPVRLLYSVGSVPFGYPRCLRCPTALEFHVSLFRFDLFSVV